MQYSTDSKERSVLVITLYDIQGLVDYMLKAASSDLVLYVHVHIPPPPLYLAPIKSD